MFLLRNFSKKNLLAVIGLMVFSLPGFASNLRVIDSSPSEGQVVSGTLWNIDFTFSEPVDPASLSQDDITFNAPGCTMLDPGCGFPPPFSLVQRTEVTYSIEFGDPGLSGASDWVFTLQNVQTPQGDQLNQNGDEVAGGPDDVFVLNFSTTDQQVEEPGDLVYTTDSSLSASLTQYAESDLVVDGATLTLSGDYRFKNVRVINGGVITAFSASQDSNTAIHIEADSILIDSTSSLDVSAKGLLPTADVDAWSGGSHGGYGAVRTGETNAPYGSYLTPINLGIGGYTNSNVRTRGGGALRITATELNLQGKLLAKGGEYDSGYNQSAGAGGSIWLDVGALTAGENAQIAADGGNGRPGSGRAGGGGRVALYYNSVLGLDLEAQVSAFGGQSGCSDCRSGGAGTVYFKDKVTSTELVRITNGPRGSFSGATPFTLSSDQPVDLSDAHLQLSGETSLPLLIGNAEIVLNVTSAGRVELSNSTVYQKSSIGIPDLVLNDVDWYQEADLSVTRLSMNGHWHQQGHEWTVSDTFDFAGIFTQSGHFNFPSGNQLLVDGYVLEYTADRVWDEIRVTNGGLITSWLASDTVTEGIHLQAGSIHVSADSSIDVSGKGLLPTADVDAWSGGSHGGYGAVRTGETNAPYGSYLTPINLGIGGYTNSNVRTRGGGALRITATELNLQGKLLAKGGEYDSGYNQSAGAGGSIWLDVGALTAGENAQIAADGGNGRPGSGRAGGGGRVALYYNSVLGLDLEAQVSAFGGQSGCSDCRSGGAGTVYFKDKVTSTELVRITNGPRGSFSGATPFTLSSDQPVDLSDAHLQLSGETSLPLLIGNAEIVLNVTSAGRVELSNSTVYQKSSIGIPDLVLNDVDWYQEADLSVTRLSMNGHWHQQGHEWTVSDTFDFAGIFTQSGHFNFPSGNQLLVDGYVLEYTADRVWDEIRVTNGGLITSWLASDTVTEGIHLQAGSIHVSADSSIDVSGKGLLPTADVDAWSGGSHGGYGAVRTGETNAPYGSYLTPINLGIGGYTNSNVRTRGGGALRITATELNLQGKLLAKGGEYDSGYNQSAGAGGSIWLDVGALTAGENAQIAADGGNGRPGSGRAGGGGRVALYYNSVLGLDLEAQVSAFGGQSGCSDCRSGGAGTVYFKDKVTSTELVRITNGPRGSFSGATPFTLSSDQPVDLSDAHLQLSGETSLPLLIGNAEIVLNVTSAGRVEFSNSTVYQKSSIGIPDLVLNDVDWYQEADLSVTHLSMNGHWYQQGHEWTVSDTFDFAGIFTQSGHFNFPSGNQLLVDGYVLEYTADRVWDEIRVTNGGLITSWLASDTVTEGIHLQAGSIHVSADSSIDVSGKGLLPTQEVGNYSGGSHGGSGGIHNRGNTNATYGSETNPITVGTGGRQSNSLSTRGGGVIRITSDLLYLEGKILADGEKSRNRI